MIDELHMVLIDMATKVFIGHGALTDHTFLLMIGNSRII